MTRDVKMMADWSPGRAVYPKRIVVPPGTTSRVSDSLTQSSVCVPVETDAGTAWVEASRPSGPMYRYLSVAVEVSPTEYSWDDTVCTPTCSIRTGLRSPLKERCTLTLVSSTLTSRQGVVTGELLSGTLKAGDGGG